MLLYIMNIIKYARRILKPFCRKRALLFVDGVRQLLTVFAAARAAAAMCVDVGGRGPAGHLSMGKRNDEYVAKAFQGFA